MKIFFVKQIFKLCPILFSGIHLTVESG